MLRLWNISHMFIVMKAMVIPSGERPFGISKYPTSIECPIIYDAIVSTVIIRP